MMIAAAISSSSVPLWAASTLDFNGTGTLTLINGSDPLALNGKSFTFSGFIDQSATPSSCPAGLPVAANACYAVPANQLTGQIGALPPIAISTASTLALVVPASGPAAMEVQFTILAYPVTAVLQLAPGSFKSNALAHPAAFAPSPQNLTGATNVPPPLSGSSVEYCSGTCSPSTATWLAITGSVSSTAPQITTLLTFTGANGSSPYSGLVFDKYSALYGTTELGGTSNLGTVFRLSPPSTTGGPWTQTVLYSFTGSGGANPYGSLVLGSNGVLYGTAQAGGARNLGVVFQLTPPAVSGSPWTETVLHSFAGGSDGAYPHASVALGKSGKLYGTTQAGGSPNLGVVFQLLPPAVAGSPWTETIVHTFAGGSDGATPQASVVVDANGNLFGTTVNGGSSNLGTVFELTPPVVGGGAWNEVMLHSFVGTDGANPQAALIRDSGGVLYGTTYKGGLNNNGVVFQLVPPASGGTWTETVLHTFVGGDGANPQAALAFDSSGALDGTTGKGGLSGNGTLFRLTPTSVPGGWIETVLHSFGGADGANPQGAVVLDSKGYIYSTTVHGGTAGTGTVFRSTP
ncbi:MAG: choice-of-anchor tandem repeat GloVer-containing protein [Bryobacteraceae bacterium]